MDVIAVLVVEDNFDDAALISESLSKEPNDGFKVEIVSTLADAVSSMNVTDFDVMLLNLTLPDSSGLDTVRQLVGRFPEIAIVVLSGRCDDKTAIQSVRYGAQDYLKKKDFSYMWLSRAIHYAIERKQIIRQKEELLADLGGALEEIEMLHRIIPICAYCRKIHNDRNEWESVEDYLQKRVETRAGHVVCPECSKTLYSKGL